MINHARLDWIAQQRRDRNYARRAVANALKYGRIQKDTCYCGSKKVEAHHPDYAKPLEVIWACKKHHVLLDKMKREEDDLNGVSIDY